MIDPEFLELLCSHAALGQTDVVLEVGAGLGFLTLLLAQKSRNVIAVEVDSHLTKILRKKLAAFDNIRLIEGDILETSISNFNKVVSNPPFSISSPLLFWLLEKSCNRAVLTFQREFARRLDAPIGSKDYSRLTVATYYRAEVELLDLVPKEAFYPKPDVDALIVQLTPVSSPPFKVDDKTVFDDVLRSLFTRRNRKVRNAILPLLHAYGLKGKAAVDRADLLPFHEKRVRQLAPEDFGVLTNALSR
jgi:16S rRNA (adenine1518-N6/adenine1519-N6)-dimethyltransferase